MTPELTALALAALLQMLQYGAYAATTIPQIGMEAAVGPRDQPVVRTGTAARVFRALNNHFEALILFTIAVLVVTLSGQSTGFTAGCGWVYLAARVLYIPAYAFGLTPWRTVVWAVGLIATTLMLIAALI